MISRQQGKGYLLEARQLFGLFVLEEDVILHTAHEHSTAVTHFKRLATRIENTPELKERLEKKRGGGGILAGHGNESITLERNPKTGKKPTLEFRPRTGRGGLGFTVDCMFFDEAMIIDDGQHQALLPTLSARPNAQIWYTGSAPDELNKAHSAVPFARLREKALREAPGVSYFEWSLDYDDPDDIPKDVLESEEAWAQANPGLGLRLDPNWVRSSELESMDANGFAVQRLGVGRWPRTDGGVDFVIPPELWAECCDEDSETGGLVAFGIDVTPDRTYASIGVAGRRKKDERFHVEVIEHKRGTDWVAPFVAELRKRHRKAPIICDTAMSGPIGPELQQLRISVIATGPKDLAQGCAMFFDATTQDSLRHIGQEELNEALRGARKRNVGNAWAWDRRDMTIDISPLCACTLALWSASTLKKAKAGIVDWNAV
jgi:hypothetical protein